MILESSKQITLTPNRSASWKHARIILASLAILTFAVASFWAALGVWAILPFAGLDIALLYFLFVSVLNKTHMQQVLTLEAETLTVEVHRNKSLISCHVFARDNCYINAQEPKQRLDKFVLLLEDHYQSVELGGFLRDQEKKELMRLLSQWRIAIKNRIEIIKKEM